MTATATAAPSSPASAPVPLQDRVSAEECQTRVDLAAAYRLVAHYGWDDLIFTHISARVPGPEHHFLIKPPTICTLPRRTHNPRRKRHHSGIHGDPPHQQPRKRSDLRSTSEVHALILGALA
jgi:hypothetical protein